MCVSNEREADERKVDERKVMIRSGTGRSSNERSKVVTVAPINTTNSSIPLTRRSLPDYRECVYMCVHARATLGGMVVPLVAGQRSVKEKEWLETLCNKSKSHHKFQDYEAHLVASHTNQLPRSLSSTVLPVTIYFFTLLFRRYKCITPFSFSFSVIISLAHSDSKNLVWRGNS